ncbi:MAG: GNAT family N-acetyltransferase [Candidatus Dormibacteria bacterium]
MDVRLRSWADGDLDLLRRLHQPAMLTHLGGPESPDAVLARHRRYVGATGIFAVERADTGEAVGFAGWWEREWTGRPVHETGWSVLPAAQGQGVATAAAGEVVRRLRHSHEHRELHAFPAVANAPSNAVCRAAGFTLVGEAVLEYPPGRFMRVNDWVVDLAAPVDG